MFYFLAHVVSIGFGRNRVGLNPLHLLIKANETNEVNVLTNNPLFP